MGVLVKVLGFLVPVLFRGTGGEGAQKAAAAGTSIVSLGAMGAGAMWLLGPGREWTVTLNGLELTGVGLAVAVALEWARRSEPPGPPTPPP